MVVRASFIEEEDRLDLVFEGNLDVSVAQSVCDLCKRLKIGPRYCIVDLYGVERIFDSGVALLRMLSRRLQALGTRVLVLGDHPQILERLPTITAEFVAIPPLRAA